MRAFVVSFALLLLLTVPELSRGQEEPQPFGFSLTQWKQTLTEVGQLAEQSNLGAGEVETQRGRLADLLAEVAATKAGVQQSLDPLLSQLEALGPPPAEGEPPEAPDVALQREDLNERIASLQGHIKQAGLVEAQALDLDSRLSAVVRVAAVEQLLDRNPFPLAPETVVAAVPEFFLHLGELAGAPGDWWSRLPEDQRREVLFYRIPVILVFAVAFGWVARRILLARLGRRPDVADPTYARRLLGAIAEGFGNGLIPALIFGGILYRTVEGRSLFTGLLADMVIALCTAFIVFILARALSRAALAPNFPAWRLEDIAPENARTIARTVELLAAVFAVDIFFLLSLESLPVSQGLDSLYALATAVIEAGLMISLTRGHLWVLQSEAPEDGEAPPAAQETQQSKHRVWLLLRLAIILVSVATVAAALLGYTNLSDFLLEGLLVSAALVGGLYLVRGLLREIVGAALRTNLVQDKLALRHPTRSLIKFWTRALLDLVILLFGLTLLLPIWGVPLSDMLRWTGRALQGITIGNVTISVTDLLAGLLVFAAVIVLTRMLQRLLSQRVLPQTTLDSGVQNSISAGLGYVGIALAAALGSSAIGLDLSNLALIAGALSVGIGFGLQTVVNNFVSGLILLIERPIKVGDWIIAAGHEGYVKRINVRATELETFQRASVIIPNSELISSSVINWTHKNKLGRVEVPVGVAYGSDVQLVMDTLMDCLKADSRVLTWPEPYVVFLNFGDSSLDFSARGYIGDVEWVLSISSDLRIAIEKAFREKGIEIPFPQRDIHLRDIDRLTEAIEGRAKTSRKATTHAAKAEKPAPSTPGGPPLGDSDGDGS